MKRKEKKENKIRYGALSVLFGSLSRIGERPSPYFAIFSCVQSFIFCLNRLFEKKKNEYKKFKRREGERTMKKKNEKKENEQKIKNGIAFECNSALLIL